MLTQQVLKSACTSEQTPNHDFYVLDSSQKIIYMNRTAYSVQMRTYL